MGTEEERKTKLANPDLRASMKAEYDRTKQPRALGDISTFVCRGVNNEELSKKYRDRLVGDIAREENKHVIDVLLFGSQRRFPPRIHVGGARLDEAPGVPFFVLGRVEPF